jgi:hypothetical protein
MLMNKNIYLMMIVIIYHYSVIIIISFYHFLLRLLYLIDSLHFYTTTIQGHDKFNVKTDDKFLSSSSSKLEKTIRIGKMITLDI